MSSRALRKMRNEDDLPSPEEEDEVASPARKPTGANAFSLVNLGHSFLIIVRAKKYLHRV